MVKINIKIAKEDSTLQDLSRKISDLSGFYKDFAALELSSTKLRYKNSEKPSGERWRDPFTIRRERGGSSFSQAQAWGYFKASHFHALPVGWRLFNRGSGDKPMFDTGNLFNSIQQDSGKNYAAVGTNVQYGKHVQALGFEFLGVNENTKNNIERALALQFKENKK